MIRIGLLGDQGRMGQKVIGLLKDEYSHRAVLAASVNRKSSSSSMSQLLDADVVIDFSSPAAMIDLIDLALQKKKNLPAFVIGSTGWDQEGRTKIQTLSQQAQIVHASNFSTGVGALLEILRQSAPLLQKLGYTPVIVETHHRHKKDAPSGTALAIQEAIQSEHPVQTHSIRSGEIIGDHEVTFYGASDHLTLGHFAQDRAIFARGAIDVALWLVHRKEQNPGTYGLFKMSDFLKESML